LKTDPLGKSCNKFSRIRASVEGTQSGASSGLRNFVNDFFAGEESADILERNLFSGSPFIQLRDM
jgi:hypothetical protein